MGPLLGACGSDVTVDGQGGGPTMGTGGGPATGAGGAPACDGTSVRSLVSQASPCFGGTVGFDPDWAKLYLGYPTQLSLCPASGPTALAAQQSITKPAAAAAAVTAACDGQMPMLIDGPVTKQATEMWFAIEEACPGAATFPVPAFKISIDANGKVASVMADPLSPVSLPPALIDCMMMALTSHTFACLSNFEICPGDGGDP